MSETDLEKLERAADEAYLHHVNLVSQRNSELSDLMAAYRRKVEAELASRYDALLVDAALKSKLAKEAHERAKEEEGLRRSWPLPLGTRMVEWKYRGRFAYRPENRVLTGRVGVLEVITGDSDHPANSASYSMAKRGELVVRILKRDGSPSKLYVQGSRMRYGWVPEGKDLKAQDLNWWKVEEGR